ncbi:MAG: hypothetical protein FJY85_23970 [Deltaproteobacteria bacterium]|nr:hypothetical protein [Deltaproteobacteria bacterium]
MEEHPVDRLIFENSDAVTDLDSLAKGYILSCRCEGKSPKTIRKHRRCLPKALSTFGLCPTTADVNAHLQWLACSIGGKYADFKDIRAFYNWLYSPRSGFPFKPEENPVRWVDAPKRPVRILPSLTQEQVLVLIG